MATTTKKKELRVWLTGAGGQLGNSITRHFADEEGIRWLPTTRDVVDLSNRDEVHRFFNFYKPDVVVNPAAFTNVDECEVNQEDARAMNAEFPKVIAEHCQENKSVLLHFSTDYVFGGDRSHHTPYKESDPTDPVNVYGATKLEGERNVLETCDTSYVWRTAWLYSPYGKNFYRTIRRKALDRETFKVVANEVGSPTSTIHLAKGVVQCIRSLGTDKQLPFGLYHFADIGEVSRYDFARAILDLDPHTADLEIDPCFQGEYPIIAPRPFYSTLNIDKVHHFYPKLKITWQEALREVYEIERLINESK